MTTILYMFWSGFSAVAAVVPVLGPIGLNAAQVYTPTAGAALCYQPGASASEIHTPTATAGEVFR